MTDPLGQSQVLTYLFGLSNSGYKIHIISFEKPERFQQFGENIEEQCNLNGIVWHPLPYTKKPPVISTLFDLYKLFITAKKLNNVFHFKLFHCRSQLTAMIGMKLAMNSGAKFIFDMRGFWVDERVEGNIWNLSNPIFKIIYRYLKRKEKEIFLHADAVVSLTYKALPLIKNIQGKPLNNQLIKVIPCCADIDFFDPRNISNEMKTTFRKELNIPEEAFVLTYLGGIGTWYLCAEMLDFFNRVLIKFPDARFLFITQEEPEMILKLVEERNIPSSKIIIKSAQRKDVPSLLSLSSASVFFIKASFSKQASSPTKHGELMSMGIPLVCNKGIGDTDQIIRDSDTGVVCDAFTTQAYDEAISNLRKSISDEQKNHIRETAKKYFSLKEGVLSYTKLYQELLH